jgi:hypothetical protein
MIGLLAMLCSVSIVSCTPKPSPVPHHDATVRCTTDCVSVSKAFVKEHALLFNEVIKLRAEVKDCHARH